MLKRKIPGSWLSIGIFCLLGSCILAFPGYRFSALVTFCIAAVIFMYVLLKALARRYPKISKIFQCLLTVGLCLVFTAGLITGILIAHTASGTREDHCDYLIVLGAGVNGTVPSLTLRERLEATAEYMQAHENTICIVSGGQGTGEDITEAACMSRWLIEKGLDPNRIWLEDKATSTQENLTFSLALIEEATGSRPLSVGIVSSEYHLFRANLMAKKLELKPVLIPARTSWITLRINYYMREVAGVWHYLVFGS